MAARKFSVNLLKKGKKNGISAARLADLLETDRRYISTMVEEARRGGALICSGNNGYYIPETKEELQETYNLMRKRAMSILFTIKYLKRAIDSWKDPD